MLVNKTNSKSNSISNSKSNSKLNSKLNSKSVDKINDFWNQGIWNFVKQKNMSNIKNKLVVNFFTQLKNYENEFNEHKVKFNIDLDNNILIDDNKKNLKKKIANFKKDNLIMLKIHSDCFSEYHNIIFEYLNNQELTKTNNPNINLSHDIICYNEKNKLDLKSNSKDLFIVDFNSQIINEHLNNFKNNIIRETKTKYDINILINTLEKNFLLIKENLENFLKCVYDNNSNDNKPILLIDTENILKSFVIQNFLKSQLDEEQYDKYFNVWNNGSCKDTNDQSQISIEDISIEEYSSKVKYIEPYTSLNLSLKKKKELLNVLIEKIVNNFNTINIITSTEIKSINDIEINFNQSNSSHLVIPIEYNNKWDIREQDDHLIVFIYILLKKLNLNPIILSNDKFGWFNDSNKLEIKNFKFLYDLELGEKKIVIDNQYTSSIYKSDNVYYSIPFVNFPFIEKIIQTNSLQTDDNEFQIIFQIIFQTKLKKISTNDIKKIIEYLFFYSTNGPIQYIINNLNKIIEFVINYLEYIANNFNSICNFLSSKSKNNVFKISIGIDDRILDDILIIPSTSIIDSQNAISGANNKKNFSKHEIKQYLVMLDNYLKLVEIYVILKFVIYKIYISNYDTSEYVDNLCLIFDYIIGIYDLIDEHIYKIRKLSNSKSEQNVIFKKINTVYLFIRKQGYLKKNIFFTDI